MKSRTLMSAKNAFWSYFSMGATMILQFVSRTIFIYFLGKDFLGVNGLFSNVLGVLSFAELGISSAMNFSLYKPVAEGDTEKIKSFMYCYKWAYRGVAALIAVMGLCLFPFLDVLVKDPGNVGNIHLYYLIFLFNTVTSYFVTYKFSITNAEQKNYVCTNVNLICSVATTIFQIIALLVWRNYLFYLLVAAVIGLVQKIFMSAYMNKLYPYLKDKNVEKLSKNEIKVLANKVKAMVMHRLGDICVHQTDNIIVSAFINVGTVGIMSNYNLLINTISSFMNILFNSVVGSLGNLVATETKEKQHEIYKSYRFVTFWFYGFTSIALYVLMTPFITLWIGENMTIGNFVVALLILDYYMIGHRFTISNFKAAGGMFEKDRYVSIIRAVINLVSSIILVKLIGLPGVYLGTILQGAFSTIITPILLYKDLFGVSCKHYFINGVKYLIAVLIPMTVCVILRNLIMPEITVIRFILTMICVAIIPNAMFIMFFFKTKEFKYVLNMVKQFKRH